MLKLSNVVKNYDVGTQEVNALRGIDVSFRKNEFVSILGPSGCGKTTIMNIIGGLDQYTSGDLIINGESTKDFKDENWDNYRNKRIGFVFQSYNLIMHQTVLGNVELALTLSGISPSERKKRATKVLKDVGLADQLYKKPNQLSGGQMQRVAIARALVNEPEILLADEPTGALDTETSIQILDLIKEVAKDRLVIMVTHNSVLAHQYSNRVINMLDGKFVDDSNPYVSKTKVKKVTKEDKAKKLREEKTSMSFITAMGLSFKNLLTKKWRTVLTAIAGSIGIIGVALILAVSSGTNSYVDKVQADTLSSNPLEITEQVFDFEAIMTQMMQDGKMDKFPTNEEIMAKAGLNFADAFHKNNISEEYLTYIKDQLDPNWYNDLDFSTGMNIAFYKKDGTNYQEIKNSAPAGPPIGSSNSPIQKLGNEEFVTTQYDLLKGTYPKQANELVLIINEYNEISKDILESLGIEAEDVDGKSVVIDFDEVLGKKLYVAYNDNRFVKDGNKFNEVSEVTEVDELIITGIIRINTQTTMGMLQEGIGYTDALREKALDENYNSEIAQYLRDNKDSNINFKTGNPYTDVTFPMPSSKEEQFNKDYRSLGATKLANGVKIYAKDFDSKEGIKQKLDEYNTTNNLTGDEKLVYVDFAEIFGNAMNQIVNIITIVLVAFTSISLVVSSIMIGIITYVSVLERNKEIGILRSIGARKKDITRVFNAETFIIGLFSGIIGITTTYLVSIPANIIIKRLSDVDNIASLPIFSAFILIMITVGLTVLAGLIPARGAAKKDPVEALRTE